MFPLVDDVMTEAEARYLADLRVDCESILGDGARLVDLRRETEDDGVRLVAHYRLGARNCESAGVGETVLDAHRVLRARILFDRVRFGFSELVDRR